jgi:hypothetical protein
VAQVFEFDDSPLVFGKNWPTARITKISRSLGEADEAVQLSDNLDREQPSFVISIKSSTKHPYHVLDHL